MVGPTGAGAALVWCQSTIFPFFTRTIAVAFWPGPSHLLFCRFPRMKVARVVFPLDLIATIRPEQGRAAFQAIASACVLRRRVVPAWTISAPGAKSFAAPWLSPTLSCWLQARTTLSAEGGVEPQPARTPAESKGRTSGSRKARD